MKPQHLNNNFSISGQGPAVVLLHSSMSSKDQWLILASTLQPMFKVIAVDLAGYGNSPFPDDPESFSTEDEAKRVLNILDPLFGPDTPFHLVGHSFGGAIALKLATLSHHRLMSVTVFEPVVFHLMDPAGKASGHVKKVVTNINDAIISNARESATRIFIDFWSGQGTFDAMHPKSRDLSVRLIDKVALDFKILFSETITLKDYAGIAAPVCMIRGATSPASSLEIFTRLAETVSHPEIHLVTGGHMSPITHFKEVNRIISSFLQRQGR